MKHIALIGSTGSIGKQTIDVCRAHGDIFSLTAICAFSDAETFSAQEREIRPEYSALVSRDGGESALALCSLSDVDTVVVAASGFAGLRYSLEALKAGKTLALANKETLVCGGEMIRALYPDADIVPVDSEHSAVWQCLGFDTKKPFRRIYITASGGPFAGRKWETLKNVTPEEALAHPTWKMGVKVTVDSATLLNKGYEIMEAHYLFNAPYDKIKAVMHPQSIVHSMVEFDDGAVMAQLSVPDMRLPIQAALSYPERIGSMCERLDFGKAMGLDFRPIEPGMYPCYDLALACAEKGGIYPAALNAASEVAVGAFLEKKIRYTDIYVAESAAIDAAVPGRADTYEALKEADGMARSAAYAAADRLSGK